MCIVPVPFLQDAVIKQIYTSQGLVTKPGIFILKLMLYDLNLQTCAKSTFICSFRDSAKMALAPVGL